MWVIAFVAIVIVLCLPALALRLFTRPLKKWLALLLVVGKIPLDTLLVSLASVAILHRPSQGLMGAVLLVAFVSYSILHDYGADITDAYPTTDDKVEEDVLSHPDH